MTGPSAAVLRKVAEDADVDTLKVLLEASSNPAELLGQADGQGQSLLHLAVRARPGDEALATVSSLLAFRAPLEQQNDRGETPLVLAVRTALAAGVGEGPWLLPVQLILEARAAAGAADKRGRTALTYAASAGSLPLCRALLSFRAEPRQANASGATAESLARRQGHQDVLELLSQVKPSKPTPKPAKPQPASETSSARLRRECEAAKLPVDWCRNEQQMWPSLKPAT
ncbi:unnamed protein product [Effrenium voratum]|nr:unnamed protein product [Effrenium voratum]